MKYYVMQDPSKEHDTFEDAERHAFRLAKMNHGITITIAKAHAEVVVEYHVTLLDEPVGGISNQDLKELAENATVGQTIKVDAEEELLENVEKVFDEHGRSAKSSEHHPHITAEFLKRENGEIK